MPINVSRLSDSVTSYLAFIVLINFLDECSVGGGDCDVACAAACTAAKALAAAAAAEEGEVMDECEGRASGRRRAGGTGGTSSAAELL